MAWLGSITYCEGEVATVVWLKDPRNREHEVSPMRIPLGVIFLVVLGSGCTTSKILPPQATPVAYREANDRLAGRSAEVRTRDGGLFHLYSVEITADSVRGSSPFGGAGSRFAIGEVFEIRAGKDRTRGGLVGGAIGAGIGLILELAGSVFDDAATIRADQPGPVREVVFSASLGVLIGAIRGSRTRYRFGR